MMDLIQPLDRDQSHSKQPQTIYQCLDVARREIRLIEVVGFRDESGIIETRLHTVSLNDNVPFFALSYVWGDPAKTTEIIVNGATIRIRQNLASALHHFRSVILKKFRVAGGDLSNERIWADALCINQDDGVERTSQVRQMASIYSGAEMVVSWLGPDEDGQLKSAFNALEQLQTGRRSQESEIFDQEWMSNFPELLQIEEDKDEIFFNKTWKSVRTMMTNEYWRRAWVVQEMALARSLYFLAGNSVLDFSTLYEFWIFLRRIQTGETTRPECIGRHLWLLLSNRGVFNEPSLEIVLMARAKPDHLRGIYDMVMRAQAHHATDPRDKIFAFQGLYGNPYPPDYGKSARRVFCEFAKIWTERLGSIDFIRYSGFSVRGHDSLNLPSWVPDWSDTTEGGQTPNMTIKGFSLHQDIEYGTDYPLQVTESFRLSSRGIACDAVAEVFPMPNSSPGTTSDLMKNLAIQNTPNMVPKLQILIRTLIWDWNQSKQRRLNVLTDSIYLYFMFMQFIRTTLGYTDASTVQFIEDLRLLEHVDGKLLLYRVFPGLEDGDVSAGLEELAAYEFQGPYQYQQYFDSMRLFQTECGQVGYARLGLQSGDKIFILNGSDIPVILRDKGDHYILVGVCFVLGYMDGEVGELVRDGKLNIQEVNID